MNKVVLIGRLASDPELKYVGEKETARLRVRFAIPRGPRPGEEADFVDLVFWGGAAEAVAKYGAKGTKIGVEGRLESYTYETDNGNRHGVQVTVEGFEFLDGKPQGQAVEAEDTQPAPPPAKTAQRAAQPARPVANKAVAAAGGGRRSSRVPI
ncbi:MAG: single-stranded DNA-binding protein [Bacillota bacterium]